MPTDSERLNAVHANIAAAARRSGRDPGEICLVGVCKAQPAEKVRAAVAAGLEDLGANYVQEWGAQVDAVQADHIRWHFVGRIQRKKLGKLVGHVALIHSVDRWEVLEAIQQRAAQKGVRQRVLVQVNIAGEETKGGVEPGELVLMLKEASGLADVEVRGLMFMPPMAADPELSRPWFRKGYSLLQETRRALGEAGAQLKELSMGMSGDYVQAVEEGATIVRVGTAIFGPRK